MPYTIRILIVHIIQTAFFTLDEEIKMTNRRVNALDNVSSFLSLFFNSSSSGRHSKT